VCFTHATTTTAVTTTATTTGLDGSQVSAHELETKWVQHFHKEVLANQKLQRFFKELLLWGTNIDTLFSSSRRLRFCGGGGGHCARCASSGRGRGRGAAVAAEGYHITVFKGVAEVLEGSPCTWHQRRGNHRWARCPNVTHHDLFHCLAVLFCWGGGGSGRRGSQKKNSQNE
jgi:hypothetical protein